MRYMAAATQVLLITLTLIVVVHTVTLRDAFLMSLEFRNEVKNKTGQFKFTDLKSYYNPEFFVYKKRVGYVPPSPDDSQTR